MHKPPSRGSRAVAGAAGDVQRVLLGPRNDAKPACARKHTHARERGASGRNGGGGVPSSRGKLAAAEGSNGGARVGRAGAREGRGYGRAFFHAKNRPSEQHGACQKQGGEGGEVGEAAGNACAGGGCAWASAGRLHVRYGVDTVRYVLYQLYQPSVQIQ